ncbi:MAG TPA: hypothetical protein VES65_01275 [Solirubrobacteraceae bacterium]|nr:hypothetical protein [Solirubrobacteraceae bacterium]
MPDEKPIRDIAAEWDELERDALYLLTEPDSGQPLWSVEDIGRALEQPDRAIDAVRGLHRASLIHRTSDGYVFASRAGVRLVQIVGQVV